MMNKKPQHCPYNVVAVKNFFENISVRNYFLLLTGIGNFVAQKMIVFYGM